MTENNTTLTSKRGYAKGVFQVGIMVHDIDECLRLFCDTLGMKVEIVAQKSPASAGLNHEIML